MRLLLQPDAVLPDPEHLLRDHVVVVEAGRVAALLPAQEAGPEGLRQRFPGELWTPAPLLLHAHLESHDAPSTVWPRVRFADWVAALLEWRKDPTRLPPAASALAALEELAATGCGLVVAHYAERGADGHDREFGVPPPLPEVVALRELLAPAPEEAPDLLQEIDSRPPGMGQGYALHAPYSVSEALARGVFARARAWAVPVSIHLGEHAEERSLLAAGDGPLADLLRARGRPLKDRRWSSPVDWLEDVGGLGPPTLVVHGGDLRPAERQRLQAAGVPVVWCPGTHLYFDRPRLHLAPGEPAPLLGCDSRASNSCLAPLRELRLARALCPGPSPAEWWDALTRRAAQALGRRDLGVVAPGARARFLRLPARIAEEGAAGTVERLCGDPDLRPLGPPLEPPAGRRSGPPSSRGGGLPGGG